MKHFSLVTVILLSLVYPLEIAAQEIPIQYQGIFTDSPTGCPRDHYFLRVTPKSFTMYVSRTGKQGQKITDEHNCSLVAITKRGSGHQLELRCTVMFTDLNRLRLEEIEEHWQSTSESGILVDGKGNYRRCNLP